VKRLLSQTIFPRAEGLLERPAARRALQFIGFRKQAGRYHCLMDFLFCELFPRPWMRHCRLFYEGRGPQLKDLLASDQIERHDRLLVLALDLAQRRLEEQRPTTWKLFRQEVLGLA
jgi:hypothetical protein